MTDSNFTIGQTIEATVNAPDSFYKRVIGKIVEIKSNGFIQIQATMVISKWSDSWKEHPTSCGMAIKPQNIVR